MDEPTTALERQRDLSDLCRNNRLLGRHVRWLAETESTNDLCHAVPADQLGLVAVADVQTAGRGQRGNRWHAPPGVGLLMSFAIDPPAPLQQACSLVAWAAVGVATTLRQHGIDARIKWPNDILVRDKKIAGILVERRRWTVIGIGINVNQQAGDFPPDLVTPATSLLLETGRRHSRPALAGELLRQLDADYSAIAAGSLAIYERWWPLSCHQVGDNVQVVTRSSKVVGRIVAVHPCAGVILEEPGGEQRSFEAANVVRLV